LAERDASTLPQPAELLRAALEKVVFFEWRVSELSAELAAAQTRCANAEATRAEAEEEARTAAALLKKARAQCVELESERVRLSSLLAHPAHAAADPEPGALQAERRRTAFLAAELENVRGELARSRAERERWLSEMVAQARSGDEAPAALAEFISELRGDVIALRDHQKKCEALLVEAGITPPVLESAVATAVEPRQPEAVQDARRMWEEGRLAPALAATPFALPAEPRAGAAANALADQCLRSLLSSDPARREQAARHLCAAPLPAAAPAVASALSQESDPKARAQLARALAACGGEGAAEIVSQLQSAAEPPLVRMAALEALCAIATRARAALEAAARDESGAVRRRAAAISASAGFDDLVSQLAADADPSVRGAVTAAKREAPPEPRAAAPAPEPNAAEPKAAPAPAAASRDPVRAALRRLVLEGGSR
jgi:HEAT repeats